MKARLRRLKIRRVAVAMALVFPLAVWVATLEGGLIVGAGPRGEGCRAFWGESVDRVAWSPSGEFLAVTATNADGLDSGEESVRAFRWPGMELVAFARLSDYDLDFAIDDVGVVSWSENLTLAPPATPTTWRLDPGGHPAAADGAFASRPAENLRVAADVSSLGILATASAPGADRPSRLCIQDARR